MKYLDEYRDEEAARKLLSRIAQEVTQPWVIMEVCGGQTHSIVRYGIDELLPSHVELVHGPGCPVCVTPLETIDRAQALAAMPNVILCSFGDMLRVPGSHGDLFSLRAQGSDVRVVYSPLDALKVAQQNPDKEVVFFAIGFETTAPANAMAIALAQRKGIRNFSALVSHVLAPPAIGAVLDAPDNRVQGFLGPGHVCAVMGLDAYHLLAQRYRVPIVVCGFEPVDMLEGILGLVRLLERGEERVENQYARSVTAKGNQEAQTLLEDVFEVCDYTFRGVGEIAMSGFRLREAYRELDAALRFDVSHVTAREPEDCISGDILRGARKPYDCPSFGTRCTPDTPRGATMVSSEGACAAYFAYGRHTRARRLPVLDGEVVAP